MFRFFSDSKTQLAITELATSKHMTVFVGAGASREVGLPSWDELLERLWGRAAEYNGWTSVQSELFPRINAVGPLGAAERIQCCLPSPNLADAIREALYEVRSFDGSSHVRDSGDFEPGPISSEIARLRLELGDTITLATTNYDQLLLRALRENGLPEAKSFCFSSKKPGVVHLHGVIGFEGPDDGENVVVLTERDYLAPTNSGWREDFLKQQLQGACLFVGASLTDLNLLSPLHRGIVPNAPRVALLTRPVSKMGESDLVLEEIDRKRWEALGVTALFADEYSDIAQFIHEVRLRHSWTFPSLPERWSAHMSHLERGILSVEPDTYRDNQINLSDGLRNVLDAMRMEFDLGDEVLSLGLCVLTKPDLGDVRPVNWVTSDRAMASPTTIEPLLFDRSSPWTAVKAICAGVGRVEAKSTYASRWRYIWAEPVFTAEPTRLPLGAVVLSTMQDESATLLPIPGKGDAVATAKVKQILQDVGRQLLEPKDD